MREGGRGAQTTDRPLAVLGHDGRPAKALRRDASANRERVLAAARRLFAERGQAVTMEEVAAEAGVGKGTLYRRYPNRAALAEAVLDALARDFQADSLGGFGEEGRALGALGRLDLFLERACAFAEGHPDLLCLTRDGGTGAYRSAPGYLWQRQVIRALLREAELSGECPPQDLDYLPDAILALLDPLLLRHQRDGVGLDQARIVAGLRALARAAVAAGAPASVT